MATEQRLRRQDFRVETVPLATAREIIEAHHYAKGCANTAVYRFGLFRAGDPWNCLGAALWMPPTKPAAVATYPDNWRRVLALSRLAIVPDVPKNAASFLIGECVRRIRRDGKWECLVTYADTAQNHTGAIYRATNWEYCGLTNPEALWVDANGRMVARLATKTRTKAQMLALGHRPVGKFAKHKFRMVLR